MMGGGDRELAEAAATQHDTQLVATTLNLATKGNTSVMMTRAVDEMSRAMEHLAKELERKLSDDRELLWTGYDPNKQPSRELGS